MTTIHSSVQGNDLKLLEFYLQEPQFGENLGNVRARFIRISDDLRRKKAGESLGIILTEYTRMESRRTEPRTPQASQNWEREEDGLEKIRQAWEKAVSDNESFRSSTAA